MKLITNGLAPVSLRLLEGKVGGLFSGKNRAGLGVKAGGPITLTAALPSLHLRLSSFYKHTTGPTSCTMNGTTLLPVRDVRTSIPMKGRTI